MATKSKNGNTAPQGPAGEGWQETGLGENPLWFAKEKGAIIQGLLIGRQARFNGPGHILQVKLTASCPVVQGKGDAKEARTAEAGEIVCLDENYKLREAGSLAEKEPGCHEVWVNFVDKVKIEGGKTAWDIKVRRRRVKEFVAPTMDEIPF